MLEIKAVREGANVTRVEAVMRLAEYKGRPFIEVWREMVGESS